MRVCAAVFLVAALFIADADAPPAAAVDVPMRDGVMLKTDVYLPEPNAAHPVILVRSPYPRSVVKGEAEKFRAKGYAVVVQDVRGTGQSQGTFTGFLDDGWVGNTDGADTVSWIAEQTWCNGRIGTLGLSAGANTQSLLAPASTRVACQYLDSGATNFYHDLAYPGGVWRPEQTDAWFKLFGERGEAARRTLREHPRYDEFWKNLDAEAAAPRITAPGMHVGGWFDIFRDGTLRAFTSRQYQGGDGARGNQRLIMRWIGHGAYKSDLPLKFPANVGDVKISRERDRFLAYWLKGEDNGIDKEPPVQFYVIGDDSEPDAPGMEWRSAKRWPPYPPKEETLYLFGESVQASPPTAAVTRSFTFNPADPCPTVGGFNLTIPFGPYDQRDLLARKDVLLYAGEAIEKPREVIGRVRVVLYVSSDAPDTDFTAKLIDIFPDGRHLLVTESIMRVKYREGFDRVAPPLTPDQVVPIEIDLGTTSWVFNKGHRIGVLVSSSNYPHFEVNPNTGEDFPGDNLRAANNSVHTSSAYPSALILPVRDAAADSDSDGITDEIEWDNGTDYRNADSR